MIAIIFIMLLSLFFISYYYERTHYYKVVLVKSDIDSKSYLVRDQEDKQLAANLLSKIWINIQKLDEHLYNNKNNYKNYEKYIEQMHNKLKKTKIQESTDNGVYTSYSINKGEQIIFCLRSRRETGKLHELNLLMYVVLHELAHVACPEYGHTDLFKEIFAFLANEGVKINIYNKIDFRLNNREYCGLTISESII